MILFHISLLICCFFSTATCSDFLSHQHITEEEISQSNFEGKMYCFNFVKQDYLGKLDSVEEYNWIQSNFKQIEEKNTSQNIFDHNNGGPNGMAWNSTYDLYVFVEYTMPIIEESINIKLNKYSANEIKPYFYINDLRNSSIICFKIPQDTWEKRLRNMTSEDIPQIYGIGAIDSIQSNNVAPLDIGEILKITVKATNIEKKTISTSAYYHIAYGE